MELRKVIFKRWIPIEHKQVSEIKKERVEGTGQYESDFTNYGRFHQWANTYGVFENGIGNLTVALVELSDGTIEEVLPENLKFIDK